MDDTPGRCAAASCCSLFSTARSRPSPQTRWRRSRGRAARRATTPPLTSGIWHLIPEVPPRSPKRLQGPKLDKLNTLCHTPRSRRGTTGTCGHPVIDLPRRGTNVQPTSGPGLISPCPRGTPFPLEGFKRTSRLVRLRRTCPPELQRRRATLRRPRSMTYDLWSRITAAPRTTSSMAATAPRNCRGGPPCRRPPSGDRGSGG